MDRFKRAVLPGLVLAACASFPLGAAAELITTDIFTGNVGVSIDGIGSNSSPVGDVQVSVPVGSTVLKAYLYSAGVPIGGPFGGPSTLADYNSAGITLDGNPITSFDTLVGAVSTRADIDRWRTARADVTSLISGIVGGGGDFSLSVTEGGLNTTIDGEVLVVVYSNPALPLGSVALLDGGQNTGGETTTVNFAAPLTDPTVPGFVATMSIADSFSCCGQASTITVNGLPLTSNAGNNDDGLVVADGSLITVGGLGDVFGVDTYDGDTELYDLRPFLSTGDTSFSLFTSNATNDDNIFFMALQVTGEIRDVNPTPAPEPASLALLGLGLGLLCLARRRQR